MAIDPSLSTSNDDLVTYGRVQTYIEKCEEYSTKPNSGVLKILETFDRDANRSTLALAGLKGNYLGDRGAVVFLQVAQELNLFENVRSLDFSGQGIRDTATELLVQVLGSALNLSSLNLSDNVISTKAGNKLFAWIQKQTNVKEIILVGTRIDASLRRKMEVLLEKRKNGNSK